MKKIWKVLGIGALAASLLPYASVTDEETGEKSLHALLWQVKRRPSGDGEKDVITLSIGPKAPWKALREEEELFAGEEPAQALDESAAEGAEEQDGAQA